MDDFNETKSNLAHYRKKGEGSYFVRDLGEIIYGSDVRADYFVESEFLTTVICIIHK